MKIILLISSLVFLVSCGKSAEGLGILNKKTIYTVTPAEAEQYSYEFIQNKCTTGDQAFDTFDQVCQALADHSLNNECAYEQRKNLFESESCSGRYL